MKPNSGAREVESSGITASSVFGISLKDSAHIMTILRDTLYSDKVLAVLREYSSNAWDAHKMVGKPDLPIKIVLPTQMEPTLVIQDFGPGLSQSDVFDVYTQYGASTKRASNDAVGMLGIGSKSGFAYSDSFTVISCHGGKRRTFVALLDETDKGTINLLHEEDCGSDTGVTIQIPIQPRDIYEFTDKAQKLFSYFTPRPDINTDLPPVQAAMAELTHGAIAEHGDGWIALMGCVPYRINLDQITGPSAPNGGINDYISKLSGILKFNIGEVQVSASREELKYSTSTKAALVKKFELLTEEFVKGTISSIQNNTGLSPWQKRLRARVLDRLELPVPKDFKVWTQDHVDLKHEADVFTISSYNGGGDVLRIPIADPVRLLIRDEIKGLAGYGLKYHDYVVTPVGNSTIAEVEKELAKCLIAAGIEGLPVQRISSLPWQAPVKNRHGKTINPKHHVKTFRLADKARFHSPWSGAWVIENRVPTDNDVFVILSGFKTEHMNYNFYTMYKEDVNIANLLGMKMPPVYGYKTSDAKPLTPDKVQGTHYPVWRVEFAKSILKQDHIRRMLISRQWAEVIDSVRLVDRRKKVSSPYSRMRDALGPLHPITLLLKKQQDGKRVTKKLKWEKLEALDDLHKIIRQADAAAVDEVSEAEKFFNSIIETYPLLEIDRGIHKIWDEDDCDKWLEYINLVDRMAVLEKGGTNGTRVHDNERLDSGGVAGEAAHSEEGSTELRGPEESNPEGGLGLHTEASDGNGEHQGVVERAVQDQQWTSVLSGYSSPGSDQPQNYGYGCSGRGSNSGI